MSEAMACDDTNDKINTKFYVVTGFPGDSRWRSFRPWRQERRFVALG